MRAKGKNGPADFSWQPSRALAGSRWDCTGEGRRGAVRRIADARQTSKPRDGRLRAGMAEDRPDANCPFFRFGKKGQFELRAESTDQPAFSSRHSDRSRRSTISRVISRSRTRLLLG